MRPIDIFFAILVAVIWGGNFVAAKYGLSHFPPYFLTSLRFALVGVMLAPFVPVPPKSQWLPLFTFATVMGGLQFATLYTALYMGLDIPSSAIIGQMGVPFSCLLGALFLKDHLGIWRIGGMVIAFIGMSIVAGTPSVLANPLAFAIAVGSSFFWGVGNIMIKRIHGVSSFQMLVWMALLSAPQIFLVSLLFEHPSWQLLQTATPAVWLSFSYTVIASTIVAYGLWYHLIQHHPVSHVTPFSLLTPVFGIFISQFYYHETLTWHILLGGAITIIGVAIIVIRRPKLAVLNRTA